MADVAGPSALVKWPNDVWIDGRKVAGILVEARGWAVLGIGVNVALDPATLPDEVAAIAGTLGRDPSEIDATLAELLAALETRLGEAKTATLAALRERDALAGKTVALGRRRGHRRGHRRHRRAARAPPRRHDDRAQRGRGHAERRPHTARRRRVV